MFCKNSVQIKNIFTELGSLVNGCEILTEDWSLRPTPCPIFSSIPKQLFFQKHSECMMEVTGKCTVFLCSYAH